MSTPTEKPMSPPEPRLCVPLGHEVEEAWAPLGAGVLLFDAPHVWLATTRSVVAAAAGTSIVAWVSEADGGTTVDLTSGLEEAGLSWVEHDRMDLAISLFPMDPSWGLKAFAEARCIGADDLQPLLTVFSVCCPYGGVPFETPTPLTLSGAVSRIEKDARTLYSTAPLLPLNAGAPLLAIPKTKGNVYLAGTLTNSALIPEPIPSIPPVRISVAITAEAIWELIRSDAAQAQRASLG